MHARFAKTSYMFWRKAAHVLGLAVVLLSVSQLVLLWKVMHAEKSWILVPHLSKAAALSNKRVSKEYITSWADHLTRTLLCVNADIMASRMGEVLAISSLAGHGTIEARLKKEAAELKKHNLTTAFYPQSFRVFEDARTIEVEGVFHTYFGEDKAPVSQKRTWVLVWERGETDMILLHDFYEKGEKDTK